MRVDCIRSRKGHKAAQEKRPVSTFDIRISWYFHRFYLLLFFSTVVLEKLGPVVQS